MTAWSKPFNKMLKNGENAGKYNFGKMALTENIFRGSPYCKQRHTRGEASSDSIFSCPFSSTRETECLRSILPTARGGGGTGCNHSAANFNHQVLTVRTTKKLVWEHIISPLASMSSKKKLQRLIDAKVLIQLLHDYCNSIELTTKYSPTLWMESSRTMVTAQ